MNLDIGDNKLMKRILLNYLLEVLLTWIALALYLLAPWSLFTFENGIMGFQDNPFHKDVLRYSAIIYSVIALPIVIVKAYKDEDTKFRLLLLKLSQNGSFLKLDKESKTILRLFFLKYFFIPLMLPGVIFYLIELIQFISNLPTMSDAGGIVLYFNNYIFPLIFCAGMMIALSVASYSYIINSEVLGMKVKSVDTAWTGWLVCLVCYLPFFSIVESFVDFPAKDFAFFKNQEVTLVVRTFLVSVLTCKIYSIFCLGSRFSNLTNRGITTNGPYKVIRHPIYVCKNIVWWVTALPYIKGQPIGILCMIFWTGLYVARSLSEERHLRSEEESYRKYCQVVRYRFIPYVI